MSNLHMKYNMRMIMAAFILALRVHKCDKNKKGHTNITNIAGNLSCTCLDFVHNPVSTELNSTMFSQSKDECKETRMGETYTGKKSTTIKGFACQHWALQYPNKHVIGSKDEEFIDGSINAAQNFCRNPSYSSYGPWCFTTIHEVPSDFCLIPMCSEPAASVHPECKVDRQGVSYQGKIDKAANGKSCLPWYLFPFSERMHFPDMKVDDALNYCRNPTNHPTGPTCMTGQAADFGDVPFCSDVIIDHKNCKTTRQGIDYAGNISTTVRGYECQVWKDQYPHKNTILKMIY